MATISERLRTAQRNPANRGGCVTCKWWHTISDDTKKLIQEWIDQEYSVKQLYEILSAPSDDPKEPALSISITGFRLHMNHHNDKCRPSV